MSLFDIHWLPYHRDGSDKGWLAELACGFVKVVWQGPQAPFSEDIPAGATYIYRDYEAELTRDRMATDPLGYAREHIEKLARAADYLRGRGLPSDRILVSLLNEPNIWAPAESPDKLVDYSCEAHRIGHPYDLNLLSGEWGVGWPGNGKTPGEQNPSEPAPVQWSWWKPVIDMMRPNDHLGCHEYWADLGPGENWGWWAGRILKCPYRVPILITECGIDMAVKQPGNYTGWYHALPGNPTQRAQTYIDHIWDYAGRMAQDERVQGLFIFTHDADTDGLWNGYDIRNANIQTAYRNKNAVEPFPQAQPFEWGEQPPQPGETVKGIDISYWQRSGINWDAFKAEGNTFVYVRLSKGLSMDSAGYGHIDQARFREIKTGAYHFLEKAYDGTRQARFFASLVQPLDLQLKPAVDVEDEGLTIAFMRDFIEEWFERSSKGLDIYTRAEYWDRKFGHQIDDLIAKYRIGLWAASWNVDEPILPRSWDTWDTWQTGVKLGPEFPTAIDRDVRHGNEEPPPPPVEEFTVSYTAGLPLVAGNYLKAGVTLTITDPWNNSRSTTSGTKPEWGANGWELWASTPTDLHMLTVEGKIWSVQMKQGMTAICSWT